MNDIYVIVAENDKPHKIQGKDFFDDKGPIVFEQYTRDADLESIKERVPILQKSYGNCRIAKLVFIEESNV